MGAQGTVSSHISNNPPIQTTIYSKGNLMVTINYGENIIQFKIINTLNLQQFQPEINKILEKLQITAQTINLMNLICKTEISTPISPAEALTNLVNKSALETISKILEVPSMEVLRISLANSNWTDGDFAIAIEPLATDPQNQYWFVIKHATKSLFNFNKVLEKFNSQTVEDIIKGIRGE